MKHINIYAKLLNIKMYSIYELRDGKNRYNITLYLDAKNHNAYVIDPDNPYLNLSGYFKNINSISVNDSYLNYIVNHVVAKFKLDSYGDTIQLIDFIHERDNFSNKNPKWKYKLNRYIKHFKSYFKNFKV